MRKLKARYEKWKIWNQYNHFGWLKRVLIFLHIIHNGWFENFDIGVKENVKDD